MTVVDLTHIHLADIELAVTRQDRRVLDFSELVVAVRYTDHVNVAAAELSVTVRGPVAEVLKIGGEGTTAVVTAPIPDLATGSVVRQELWRGFFEEVVDDRWPGNIERTITAFDLGKLLMHEEDFVFVNRTLSAIITEVAEGFGIPLGAVPTTTQQLGKIIHRGRRVWDTFQEAVQRHADLTGEVYRVRASRGRLELRLQGEGSRMWEVEFGDSLTNLRRTSSIRELKNRVKIYGVFEGEEEKPSVHATIDRADSQALYGVRQAVEYLPSADDAAKVQSAAERRLDRVSVPDQSIEVTSWLLPALRAGDPLWIKDPETKVDGKYIVESVTVDWSAESASSVALCRREPVDPGLLLDEVTVA